MCKNWSIWCGDCIHLDKTRKRNGNNNVGCFQYGCNSSLNDAYICGWIREDKELKTMGCSWCNKLKVGTKFVVNSRFSDKSKKFLYCGKVHGKPLLYCYEEQKYRIAPRDYLRTQTGKIKTNVSIVRQSEEQFEASRRIATKRRKRYIEINEE